MSARKDVRNRWRKDYPRVSLRAAGKLVEDLLESADLGLRVINRSKDSVVFSVKTPNGEEYVLRTSDEEGNYGLEKAVVEKALQAGVKFPRVIASAASSKGQPFSYSLMEKLEGVGLDEVAFEERVFRAVLGQTGRQLERLNSVGCKGFGPLDLSLFKKTGKLEGKYGSWYEFLKAVLTKDIKLLTRQFSKDKPLDFAKSPLYKEKELIEKLRQIIRDTSTIEERLKKARARLGRAKPALLHGSLHEEHILVASGRFNGLVHPLSAFPGDPAWDVAYYSVMPRGEHYHYILDGYSSLRDAASFEERFHLYRLLIAFHKVQARYVSYGYLQEWPEVLDYVLEELAR